MLRFKTKTNVNGYQLQMQVDLRTNTFEIGYCLFRDLHAIVLPKRDLSKLARQFYEEGFLEKTDPAQHIQY